VYQGGELWDLSRVDPDNRRPVDFARRAALLAAISARLAAGPSARLALAREVSAPEALPDGRAKLLLVHEGLRLRRERPGTFLEGAYVPLEVAGPDAGHVIAFARRHPQGAVVCVAPRLVLSRDDRPGPWQARVALPPGAGDDLHDVVTGEPFRGKDLEVEQLYANFPVALLAGPPEQA
jgi:(1->4)-alpha-D-glucan 1-alpha-D-glucosylmutase